MDVEAPKPRRGQDRRRQDQAVGGNHRGIGVERSEFRLLLFTPQRGRAADGKLVRRRKRLNRGRLRPMASPRRPWWLRIDGYDVMPSLDQRLEDGRSKGWG